MAGAIEQNLRVGFDASLRQTAFMSPGAFELIRNIRGGRALIFSWKLRFLGQHPYTSPGLGVSTNAVIEFDGT